MSNINKHIDDIYDCFNFSNEVEIEAVNGWESDLRNKQYNRKIFFKVSGMDNDSPTLVANFSITFVDLDDFKKFGVPQEVTCKYHGEDLGQFNPEDLKFNKILKNYKEMNESLPDVAVKNVKHKI